MTRLSLLLLAALVLGPISAAQTDQTSLDDLYIDFAPPDLTAFTLVGVDGGRVSRPGTLKKLATALQTGLSPSGIPEQGVGIEITPSLIARGGRPVRSYAGAAERFSLSFASLRTGDSTRVGVGVRWVPVDGADPLSNTDASGRELRRAVGEALAGLERSANDLIGEEAIQLADDGDAFVDALQQRLRFDDSIYESLASTFGLGDRASPPTTATRKQAFADALGDRTLEPGEATTRDALFARYDSLRTRAVTGIQTLQADLNAAAEKAQADYRAATWNAASLQFAVGTTWRTGGGLEPEGLQGFVGGAHGFDTTWLQAVAHLRGQALSDRPGVEVGGRLLMGSATVRGSVEGLYGTGDLVDEDGGRLLVGGEFRLADGTFLELATGIGLPESGPAGALALGGLRYALRPARRFDGPGR